MGFLDFPFSSTLIMVSSVPKRWGHFNFEKLKSLGKSFFSSYWTASPYGGGGEGAVIMVTKVLVGGGGYNSGQNNYHTIASFSRKINFEKIVFVFTSLVLKCHM